MPRAQKAQLLQWIAHDLGDAYPGIESVSGVMGAAPLGERRVVGILGGTFEGSGMRGEDLDPSSYFFRATACRC